MRSHMVANNCRGSPRVSHGIVNRNEFYSQYPVFDGIENIWRYSKLKFDPSVSIWLREGIAIYRWIPSNTIWELALRKCFYQNKPLVSKVWYFSSRWAARVQKYLIVAVRPRILDSCPSLFPGIFRGTNGWDFASNVHINFAKEHITPPKLWESASPPFTHKGILVPREKALGTRMTQGLGDAEIYSEVFIWYISTSVSDNLYNTLIKRFLFTN